MHVGPGELKVLVVPGSRRWWCSDSREGVIKLVCCSFLGKAVVVVLVLALDIEL